MYIQHELLHPDGMCAVGCSAGYKDCNPDGVMTCYCAIAAAKGIRSLILQAANAQGISSLRPDEKIRSLQRVALWTIEILPVNGAIPSIPQDRLH